MKGLVKITFTRFVDLNANMEEVGESYGYRISDDYGTFCRSGLTKEEAAQLASDPQKALEVIQRASLEPNDTNFMASIRSQGMFLLGNRTVLVGRIRSIRPTQDLLCTTAV